jgi:DNA mismatch repair protein MutS
VAFAGEQPTVWILTGPNRGGKTTYARAVGLAHLLAQAGLHVPARAARISPVDALWTHFPTLETTTPGEGRLDDEAIRLADIFRSATSYSLILLNEVLNGTSTLEALGLANDAVRGLHLLGARAIYVTHLHELAARADEINASTPGPGTVGSLVAEVDETQDAGTHGHRRTFRIRPSPPLGISYASEIAQQHGISYPQLVELLRQRGVALTEPDGGMAAEG